MIRPYYVSYQSASGVVIDLSSPPFFWNETDLHDYGWDYAFLRKNIGYGSLIKDIAKNGRAYKVVINVWNTDQSIIHTALNTLHSTLESDILAGTPGRLYVGSQYVTGYMVASGKGDYSDQRFIRLNMEFITGSPFWITEDLHSYPTFTSSGGVTLPATLPLTLTATLNTQSLYNAHYAASSALIVMYGPATDPSFAVGTHIYTVSGTLGAGERYEIDQMARTVTKITSSGERINAFGYRGKTYSVFEPIPAGENVMGYNGQYAIDITLMQERSEPLWDATADTTDYAAAADIQAGKSVYVNGVRIIGTSHAVETGDADAIAADILSGKTAYINGLKITGSHICPINAWGEM